jgi:single-stranded DNA-binding protein
VVGWGNLAQEIQQHYHQGDRVIIEGRLSMKTIDREEGFKEKRAELTVQRIHPLGDSVSIGSSKVAPAELRSPASAVTPSSATEFGTGSPRTPEKVESRASNVGVLVDYDLEESVPQATNPPTYQKPTSEPDVDDIPF